VGKPGYPHPATDFLSLLPSGVVMIKMVFLVRKNNEKQDKGIWEIENMKVGFVWSPSSI